MTEAVFRSDAYVATCDAVVTRVSDEGVELDRTVFYPLGGGQAGDCGWLVLGDGARLRVTDARKSRREDATPDDTLHLLDPGTDWQARLAVGTPVQVADALQTFQAETGVDGFNLTYVVAHETFEDFVALVVPELQRRGVHQREYRDGTLREKLFGRGAKLSAPHVGASYRRSL